MNENEIDIDDLIEEEYIKTKEKKDLVTPRKNEITEIDVTDDDELAKAFVKMTIEDRKDAENMYNIFAPEIVAGRDRSQGSKEALAKSLELKIAASKNMIELLKIRSKKDAGNNVNIGVFGEVMNQKKAGIDLSKIKDEFDE